MDLHISCTFTISNCYLSFWIFFSLEINSLKYYWMQRCWDFFQVCYKNYIVTRMYFWGEHFCPCFSSTLLDMIFFQKLFGKTMSWQKTCSIWSPFSKYVFEHRINYSLWCNVCIYQRIPEVWRHVVQ